MTISSEEAEIINFSSEGDPRLGRNRMKRSVSELQLEEIGRCSRTATIAKTTPSWQAGLRLGRECVCGE